MIKKIKITNEYNLIVITRDNWNNIIISNNKLNLSNKNQWDQ